MKNSHYNHYLTIRNRTSNNERGFTVIILAFFFTIICLAITVAITMIVSAAMERNIVQAKLQTAMKNAVIQSVNGPLLISGQGTISQDSLQSSINQQLQKVMSNLEPSVTITSQPIVYTESDKGNPAPSGLNGTIPGPSVYLEVKLTWLMPAILGYRFQGTIPDKALISFPIYNSANQSWIS
jgi:hypothetical protein